MSRALAAIALACVALIGLMALMMMVAVFGQMFGLWEVSGLDEC